MKVTTRRIGLSLGSDFCWPSFFEQLMRRLDLQIPFGDERVTLEVDRVPISPFQLEDSCPWDLVIDRRTHWYGFTRAWIKKALILNRLYVFNNPWSVQSIEKHTTYCVMQRLGIPIPTTWLIPPKITEPHSGLQVMLDRYAQLFDLAEIAGPLSYPVFLKPYDGGAGEAVFEAAEAESLQAAYEMSGRRIMHLQEAVSSPDHSLRLLNVGPQVRLIGYNSRLPMHDRYQPGLPDLQPQDVALLGRMAKTFGAFFGWDFNSSEWMHNKRGWAVIDLANPCPDSQVTALHYHSPWLILAQIRWAVFCAVTRRPMRLNLDWSPYFEVADLGCPLDERARLWSAVANTHFETRRFEAFCREHLGHLDSAAREFFASASAYDIVHRKVQAQYPPHEVGWFTDLFWSRIQMWVDHECAKAGGTSEGLAAHPDLPLDCDHELTT